MSFSIQIGIMFEAIGPDNPLAATTFAFLAAATNVPITYITLIDGYAYSIAGISGMLFADAAIGIIACIVAAILLAKSTAARAGEESVTLPVEER
jgi:PAT family beta-lactamase induction signal transducer AmpG